MWHNLESSSKGSVSSFCTNVILLYASNEHLLFLFINRKSKCESHWMIWLLSIYWKHWHTGQVPSNWLPFPLIFTMQLSILSVKSQFFRFHTAQVLFLFWKICMSCPIHISSISKSISILDSTYLLITVKPEINSCASFSSIRLDKSRKTTGDMLLSLN